jgi:hypothetical protein
MTRNIRKYFFSEIIFTIIDEYASILLFLIRSLIDSVLIFSDANIRYIPKPSAANDPTKDTRTAMPRSVFS